MNKKKVVIFYGRKIGKKILQILNKNQDIEIISTISTSKIRKNKHIQFSKNQKNKSWKLIYEKLKKIDNFTIITAWWGFIIPKKILKLSNMNTINLHPSYLPYGRGKYPNIWAILKNEPFGASVCSLGTGIDNGGIYCQKKINVKFDSTAENLYNQSLKLCLDLFTKNYKKILYGKLKPKNKLVTGSYYHSKKIENLRKLNLNKNYKLSALIKLINASSFKGYQKPYFLRNRKKYYLDFKTSKN